ncbi:hypothetical protein HGI30_22230 [Paenibacillus albicereus]|uniref:Uracil-DNA glycosylase-like domain-containing protein n=1 Tax=Paenibacillus albicereus TaxID=2726185 RepID=A0A6H2H2W5_9BACL|nr:hypothetical protein [Paenibacillus albicereus]QJC53975.1 hypothetical protein HGI30_22230 [Paenibacillus albicereus]
MKEEERAAAWNRKSEAASRLARDRMDELRWPERFAAAAAYMAALPAKDRYSREELLAEPLLLSREGPLAIYYAPHNELAAPEARLVLAGLTPGWRQMELSLRTMRACLAAGASPAEACRQARRAARFAGPMRAGLLDMLERLGLPEALDAAFVRSDAPPHGSAANPPPGPSPARAASTPQSAASAGSDRPQLDRHPASAAPPRPDEADRSLLDHPLVHTTSVLPCPAFRDGENYSGHQPPLRRSPLLWETAMRHMEDELVRLRQPALLLPLGKAAEEAASELVRRGLLPEERLLRGFPHPSGANGHRFVQFERAFPEIKDRLDRFFEQERAVVPPKTIKEE